MSGVEDFGILASSWRRLGTGRSALRKQKNFLHPAGCSRLSHSSLMPMKLSRGSRNTLGAPFNKLLSCPSSSCCRLSSYPATRSRLLQKRNATTLVSSTAVHATKTIPPKYQELHEALNNVKKKASAHVNLGRLQLAIQGLETEDPVTRVGIIGVDNTAIARRLVRLLLADALEPEGRWESQLRSENTNPFGALLIRYGDVPNPELSTPRSPLPTLTVPSPVLQRHKLEILITSVRAPRKGEPVLNGVATSSDTFLSPSVGTPIHADGRQSLITQPVHKTLVVAGDLDEFVRAAALLSATHFSSQGDEELVDLSLNLVGKPEGVNGDVLVFDVAKAEEALRALRSSLEQAITYEHKWLEGNMDKISRWLSLASVKQTAGLPAPIRNLTVALLDAVILSIQNQAAEAEQIAKEKSISPNTRVALGNAITEFSRGAHTELQSGLAAAWSSRNWRKLAWYKLFWRVDDVSLIITDLVTNAWLPQTERAVYEMSGRLTQAGIRPTTSEEISENVKVVPVMDPTESIEPVIIAQPALAASELGAYGTAPIPDQNEVVLQQGPRERAFLATAMTAARENYMSQAIADLSFAAQQTVFKALSISGLSAGLSGLAYFSVTSGSVYESATVVALGTAFALRRMQLEWERQRSFLEDGLMDAGRTMLKETEERMRQLVRDGGKVPEDDFDVNGRAEAAAAVAATRKALEKLG